MKEPEGKFYGQTFIGVTGLSQSGKSVIADHLKFEYSFTCQPFAKPIKDALLAMGFTYAQVYGDEKDIPIPWLNGITPRKLMQTLGTEWGRNHDKDFWVKIWQHEIWKMSDKLLFAVDDYRFGNEASELRRRSALLIRVLRPGLVPGDHASETEILTLPVDYEVHNTGTKQYLTDKIDEILKDHRPWLERREYPTG